MRRRDGGPDCRDLCPAWWLRNADTQQNITQYFTTVPAADLEVALRVDAACMRDVLDSNAEWMLEKGAIEQEVARDLSEPTYKFITRLNQDLFAGTPDAHDALGTHDSFEKTTGASSKTFYRRWYAPNNAILVVAGDVDPDATLAKIKELYGSIPRSPLGRRPAVMLRPVKQESFTLDSNLPYMLAFIAYRFPAQRAPTTCSRRACMADVLASQPAISTHWCPPEKRCTRIVRAGGNLSQGERRLRCRRAAGGRRRQRRS